MSDKKGKTRALHLYHVKVGGYEYYVEAFDQLGALDLLRDQIIEHTEYSRSAGWTDPPMSLTHIGGVFARASSPEESAQREVEELLR